MLFVVFYFVTNLKHHTYIKSKIKRVFVMLDWKINSDGTVTLTYPEGTVLVKEPDFHRAFGAMISAPYQDIVRDFGIK